MCVRGTSRPAKSLNVSVLTHLGAEDPGLGLGVDLDEHGGRADEQHHEVSDAEVGEEDVCGEEDAGGGGGDAIGNDEVLELADANWSCSSLREQPVFSVMATGHSTCV